MNNKKPISGKAYHTIRVVVGLYLLYTDYSILTGDTTKGQYDVIMIIAMIAFALTAIALLYFSGKALYQILKDERNQ